MTDGRELAVCNKHDGWVASCWFSSDSDMLVSVSNNIKVHTVFLNLQFLASLEVDIRSRVILW